MRSLAPVAIVLDSSPLSLLAQREGHVQGIACRTWALRLASVGCRFFVPETADYETRREMLRVKNSAAVFRLDNLVLPPNYYVPLTTSAVRLASELWAELRQKGRPTASPDALDADVLISAQARLIVPADYGLTGVVIATENIGHMTAIAGAGPSPQVPAELWMDIHGVPSAKGTLFLP